MKYRPDVDGLRALAVLPVVLFHAHVPGLSGGFIGVDIFFVISGYLICTLIASELARGDFSIVRFYERRCRRILPALFVVFVVSGMAAVFILLPPDIESFCRSLIAATFFVSNVYFWRTSSYFDGGSEFKPLLHTWSLGVEEQFYIVMPLILFAIAKWGKAKYARWLLLLSVPSFALSVWGLSHGPTATFYLLPTRFWELAVGALVGIGLSSLTLSRAQRETIALAGLAAIAYGITMLSDESPFPGWNALLPCLGAAAIILAGGQGGSMVSGWLSARPLVFIGKISYSLYLWHWPLMALARYEAARPLTSLEGAGVVLAAFVAAVLSWRFVEMPFRQNLRIFDRRFVFASTGAAMALVTAVSVAGLSSGGPSLRYPGFVAQQISGMERYNDGSCFLNDNQTYRDWAGTSCLLSRGHERTVLLWGDSFAAHYAPGLVDDASRLSVNYLQYTASACPPVFDYYTAIRPHCQEFNDHLPELLREYGIKTVVMAGRWESLFKRGVTAEAVVRTVQRLRDQGIEVHVIGQSPVFNNDVQILFAQSGHTLATEEAAATLSFRRDVNRRLAEALPAGTFIDPLASWCDSNECDYRRGGQFLVADIGHLSSTGSGVAVASYFPFVERRVAAGH